MNFRIVCSISMNNAIAILRMILLNKQIDYGSVAIFTILVLLICEYRNLSILFSFISFIGDL
jgi:hypothetical protein